MRILFRALAIVAMLARSATGQTTDRAAMRRTALRVMDLETRRQLAGATAATIDTLLGVYSDSVVYEHPTAGAVIRGKDALRRGMLQYIGTVRSVHTSPPRVTVAHGVVVVETNATMQVLDGARWVPVARHGLRVVEFDRAGLVRRLIDYPW